MIFDISAFDMFLPNLIFYYFLYECISYFADDQQMPAKNKLKDIKQ